MGAQGGAGRERMVMDTFVELADTLASDYEVGLLLQLLVDRCGAVLGADAAGVLLEAPKGGLKLAAALSEEMVRIEELELSTGQGPCMEAYRSREPVVVEDLAECEDRWPQLVPRLLDMGMRSGQALPVKLREDCLGALNLYGRRPGRFGGDDVRLAQAFADVAAIGILQERTVAAAEERSRQLQHALDARVVVEQAKGMLAQRHGVTPQEAYEALRRHARDRNLKVRELSQQIVDGVDGVASDILDSG